MCEYISEWEKHNILWSKDYIDTRYITLDNSLSLNDELAMKKIRKEINLFAKDYKKILKNYKDGDKKIRLDNLFKNYMNRLKNIIPDEILLGNYVIKVSYRNKHISKTLAWTLFGDVIIEVPYNNKTSYEFLGKYYEMIEVQN